MTSVLRKPVSASQGPRDAQQSELFSYHGEIETPYWAQGFEQISNVGVFGVARAAPRSAIIIARWARRASARLTIAIVLSQIISAGLTAAGLLASSNVFTALLISGPNAEKVLAALPALVVVAFAVVARGALGAGASACTAALGPRLEHRAQIELYSGVLSAELIDFEDADYMALVERARRQALLRIQQASRTVSELLGSLMLAVAAVLTASLLNPLLGVLVVLAAAPQAWSSLRSAQVEMASIVKTTADSRKRDVTGDLMAGRFEAGEIRAYGLQEAILREHRRLTQSLADEAVLVGLRRTRITWLGRGFAAIGLAASLVVAGTLVYHGVIPLALAGTALLAMTIASAAVTRAVTSMSALYESSIHIELFEKCITDTARRSKVKRDLTLEGERLRDVKLENVSFAYPGKDKAALEGVSIDIPAGSLVALVGENGSGKTTLAKLIAGLYVPTAGSVKWNAVDTAELSDKTLSDHVAFVMQDPVRWPVTARMNVRIGCLEKSDPSDVAYEDAITLSGAKNVMESLESRDDTVLSRYFQGGHDLSRGQWQRFGVARALYRDADLVIADEPTASMDARAERRVIKALRHLSSTKPHSPSKIGIVVSHRLANIRDADLIVVLDGGRVVECGTHLELMDVSGGLYAELVSIQTAE